MQGEVTVITRFVSRMGILLVNSLTDKDHHTATSNTPIQYFQ